MPYRVEEAVLDKAIQREIRKLDETWKLHSRFMALVGFIAGFITAWLIGL